MIKPIENPKRLAPINPKTNVNKEDKAFHIAIVSFSNEHLKLKKSIQKHRYIIKESISIKVKIHFLLLSDKKNIQSLIEKDIYNYNKIRIFIFVLKVKEAQKYADFFPFETKFFMRETTDFVFCIDSKDSFEEIKQEFQWIQEIEKLIHSGNFYCLTDRINSQHFQEKLTNLIHSNIEQNYEGFSIKLMALSNIQIGKLFLSRGFKLFFITLIYPPNFPYDELDQRFYEKSINFAHGLRIKNVTKKLFLKNMLDFKNLSLDEELTINECLKIMSEKHKGDQTDLFLFVCNDQSLLFWERFFEKLKEDQLFWRKNEIASVLFSMKENTNIKDSEKNEVNEILKFEGKKFDSYVTSKSSLDKFIHNNIKERVEKYENFQIYLSNEFQEFNDNRKFESLKAYEIFLQHLDKKLYDEEFDRELAHELFYNQFMQKLLIQKEDILVFYANALKKIENFIKKIKKKTALFRQKKEIQNIKIIILEVLNLNEFYFEIGKDNACANVIKNYEINKISIEIKYGDQIFESTAVLMPNFSLDLKPLEASFAFDKVNHNKGFTIKLYDPNNEYFGSYSLKIQDWETRTKGKFDLNYVRKKIQTDRTMVQVNEINNVIPFLKLFFSYDKSTAPLEEDIESLNYELDRWIKAKIELNFFRVSPELNNRLNLINKRFEEMKFAKERISIRKTLSYEENNNIENLQKNLKKKRTEYMALKVILEEKNEKIKLIPIEIKQQEKKNLNRKEKEFKKKIEFIKVKEENKKKNQEINEIIIKKVENNIKELMKEIENDEHNKILKFLLDDHKTIKKSLISKQKKSSLKNLRKLLLGLFGEKEKIEIKNIVIKLDLLKEKQMIAKEKKTLEKIQSQIALNEKLIKEKKNILEKRSLLESFDSELSILENNLQNYEEKKRNMISEYKKLVNLSDKQKKEFNEKNLKDTEDMNKLSTQIEQDAKNLNELSVDIEKIEEKLEELLKNSQENKKTDEMISFFNSLKNEIEVKKLKEYLQQLMKSLSRFYLTSSVAESQIFERSKAKEVSFLESIAPLIPYGRPVLNLIAGILNFRDKTIKMNQFQSFSNITPNSSILDEIVQKSAFELIKIKKAVILQMSDNIQKGLLEQAQAKVKSWFFSKNQKIFKGLDTGAKIMANIDASTIIAHTYLKVLMYTNDNEGDIFNKKNIEKIFIQAACLVDPQKYAKILSIQDKWANFEFNFNVQEYFKKDKDYLKIFIDKDEKKKKEEKGKCVPNFFNCFKNKKKVHNLTSETEKSPTAI